MAEAAAVRALHKARMESERAKGRAASGSGTAAPATPSKLVGSEKLDVFGLLDFLRKTDQQAVRDHLVELLAEMDRHAVEFILPQLCTVFVHWPKERSRSLGSFLKRLCGESLHIGLKTVLLLTAEVPYLKGAAQGRCRNLLEECEVAVVNSNVDPSSLAGVGGSAEHGGGGGDDNGDDGNLFDVFYAKQVRSEYFNATTGLLSTLEDLSNALVNVPRADRQQTLREYVNQLDGMMTRGLYLPMGSVADPHYRILRLPPMETRALNSRDKAPFLMWVEVEWTGMACGNPSIWSAFSMREMRRAEEEGGGGGGGVKGEGAEEKAKDKEAASPASAEEAAEEVEAGAEDGNGQPGPAAPLDSLIVQDHFARDEVRSSLVEVRRVAPPDEERGVAGREESVWVRADDADLPRLEAEARASEERLARAAARAAFGEPWAARKHRIQAESPYSRRRHVDRAVSEHRSTGLIAAKGGERSGQEEAATAATAAAATGGRAGAEDEKDDTGVDESNWDAISVIFKGGDDLRQEHLAMQMIELFDEVFRHNNLPLRLTTYSVMVTAPSSGLIETIPNSISVASLKENTPGFTTLAKFFADAFEGPSYEGAVRNFCESMAAYSVVTYLLQIKDRHNGNIMLASDGRVVHIDFGFMLSNSPGGNTNFESSPFKLTREYVEVMGGEDSEAFSYFKMLVIRGFLAVREHMHKVLVLADVMLQSGNMPCFLAGAATLTQLRDRFMPGIAPEEAIPRVLELIEESIDNWRSVQYDSYQRITNDVL